MSMFFSQNDGARRRSNAPILNYDLPDATAYTGTYVTELEFDNPIFRDDVLNKSDTSNISVDEVLEVANVLREIAQTSTAESSLEQARAQFILAEAQWHRTQELREKDVIPEQDYESARATYEQARQKWEQVQSTWQANQAVLNHPLKIAFETAKSTGFFDPLYFPNVNSTITNVDPDEVKAAISSLTTEFFLRQVASGQKLNIYRTLAGDFRFNFIPVINDGASLLLIEEYRLSSFHGDYGVGRTLKTFTLLPGEKTTISLQTYKRRTENAKRASSILDSYSKESANDFESSVQREQSNRSNVAKSFSYHAEAEAEAEWGWGRAKMSGGVSGNSRSSRQQFSKNVFNATSKHAARASAQRDVEVNTSYEVRTEEGEETSVKREIANVNSSRTLNFIFRQLNQEFITILHLVDVRVGFYNGYPPASREVPLHELDTLLGEVVLEDKRETVAKAIIGEIKSIVQQSQFANHGEFIQPVADTVQLDDYANRYFVNPYYTSSYRDGSAWRCALVNSNEGLNVRLGAGKQYPVTGTLSLGEQLQANYSYTHGADGHDWVQVRAKDVEGWASLSYLDLCAPYDEPQTSNSSSIEVEGVILGVNKYVMRTDSVFVDSILGDGDGLEPSALRAKEVENDVRQLEVEKYRLLEEILRDMNSEQKLNAITQILNASGNGERFSFRISPDSK